MRYIILSAVVVNSLVGCGRTAKTTPPVEVELAATPVPGPAPEGMVWIPGGTFWMGNDKGANDEFPRRRVGISGFWMDKHEVTNAEFAKFVAATGYKTTAEQEVNPKDYPTADPKNLVPGSAVFDPPNEEIDLDGPPVWWKYVHGACWKHPEGPGSSIKGRENHPVVHITWRDAAEYAKWAKKRLPTEAEWEFAARGGLESEEFCWGSAKPGADGKWQANIFQGKFPRENTAEDGYKTTAPVGSFPPNGYGLHDMSGNVWEWCADWYQGDYYSRAPRKNPPGPEAGDIDGYGAPQRVRRGGSFLCTDQYCWRYRPSTRDKNPADSSASHTGFRCVLDAK